MSVVDIWYTFRKYPRYTVMRGFGRFRLFRHLIVLFRQAAQGKKLQNYLDECEARMGQSQFQTVDLKRFVHELQTEGVAFGLRLPEGIVNELAIFADQTACYADRKEDRGFRVKDRLSAEKQLGKPILVAQYFNITNECSAVRRLMEDPALQWIAASYLQSLPRFVGANMWWTFPVQASDEEKSRHAHMYHRDIDDYKFFKFFFYLTDVDEGDGAHVCIAASHAHPPCIKPADPWVLRRYSDEEVECFYEPESVLTISGVAGTGFAENTLCLHKGSTPSIKARLLLQLQYALFDYDVMHDSKDQKVLRMLAL